MTSSFDLRPIFFVVGSLLIILAAMMLVPMLVDLSYQDPQWQGFALSAALTVFVGVTMMLTTRAPSVTLNLRQTFLLTPLSYVALGAFGALPLMFTNVGLSPVDALFESISGITTTGSTTMSNLDQAPMGALLWRAILQWLGGVGIIAVGLIILPFLKVGGMQMFRSESSDNHEKVVPRAADFARSIGLLYVGITVFLILAYAAAGMPSFDAIANSMTTISTGGYAPHDSSFGKYQSAAVEWVGIFGMLMGGLPFVRYISLLKGDVPALWRDSQVLTYLGIVAGSTTLLVFYRLITDDVGLHDVLRGTMFNVVSIITTTGFATEDYTLWGTEAVALFYYLSYTGGCTGSTTGGMKIFRFEILFKAMKGQLDRLFNPNRVIPLSYNGALVDSEVVTSVMSFLFAYFGVILITTLILGGFGVDFITALSGATTAISNVGPGLGDTIGPAGNFSSLPDGAKLVLAGAMITGRLELFTVLVLFNPAFWRS